MALDIRGLAPLLWVYDMPTSIRFYRDRLGFVVASSSAVLGEDRFDWAMIRAGESQFMLNTIFDSDEERPERPEPSNASQRDVWLYFDCPDAAAAYATLREKGLDAEEPVRTYYGMNQVFLTDPDGYRLCFQSVAGGQ
jgi:glyoxylase I family protein